MSKIVMLFLGLTSLVALTGFQANETEPKKKSGALIIVGGGGTPKSVIKEAIRLAGGSASNVVILPQASTRADRGIGSVSMFREAGAKRVTLIKNLKTSQSKQKLNAATLIWMPGGNQNRLMTELKEAGFESLLRERHLAGVVIGGTSAGAAVQSELMITGEADQTRVSSQTTTLGQGLGLIKKAIVDQHAVKRRRFNRLLSAVLDHPKKIGLAIDEKTAIVVTDQGFSVLGSSNVLVIDAKQAQVEKVAANDNHGATGILLHVLRKGMKYKF